MKTVLLTLMGALTFGAALPVLAGPDWQVIEHARKAKLIRMQQKAAQEQRSGRDGATQQDEARKAQMMKECQEMMKKSS